MRFVFRPLSGLVLLAALLGGCAGPQAYRSPAISGSQGVVGDTVEARVVSKRPAKSLAGGVGDTVGGILGFVAGSSLGSTTRDNLVGASVGSLVGSAVGKAIETSWRPTPVYEYIVRSDSAGMFTVIEPDSSFDVGDRVYVVAGATPRLVGRAP